MSPTEHFIASNQFFGSWTLPAFSLGIADFMRPLVFQTFFGRNLIGITAAIPAKGVGWGTTKHAIPNYVRTQTALATM